MEAYDTVSRAALPNALRPPLYFALALSVVLSASVFSFGFPSKASASSIDVWWPTNNAHMQGLQPFKAIISGLDPSQYSMFWQVDGGSLVPMATNDTTYPHKEASVDLSGWTWNGQGPYEVNFVAENNQGQVIGEQQETIYNDGAAGVPSQGSTQSASDTTSMPSAPEGRTPDSSNASQSAQQVSIDNWWPTNNAHMQGLQPFKAIISGLDPSQYSMFWQVDGGSLVPMATNDTTYPHKEASVDLSGWTWNGQGPYEVNFVAENNQGQVIGEKSIPIYVDAGGQLQASAQPQSTSKALPSSLSPSGDPLSGASLYVDPNSEAAAQEKAWQGNASEASAMQVLAGAPTAVWFGDWDSSVENDVHSTVEAAAQAGQVPVLVAYDIPDRDCDGYSAGGATSDSAYQSWIQSFAAGIGSNKAVVILEPDALADLSCLSSSSQADRLALLSSAVRVLKQNSNTLVYIDAGHAGWVDASAMAQDLKQASVAQANGFALDVSNFDSTPSEEAYGGQISQQLGGEHFVIDTSRNGNGSDGQWCNPQNAAIGSLPTTQSGNPLVDAFLWIKVPGESDGACNGGPSAGTWWPQYALSLVENAQ